MDAIVPPRQSPIHFIDGDGIRRDGQALRLEGFDAPEIHHAKSELEQSRGYKALVRIKQLHAAAKSVEIRPAGKREKYGRMLVRLILDGRDVTEIAIAEGWGSPYKGKGPKPDWSNPATPFPDELPGVDLPDEPLKRTRKES